MTGWLTHGWFDSCRDQYAHLYKCILTQTNTHAHLYIHVTRTPIHANPNTPIHAHTHAYAYTRTPIHTSHIHTHTHVTRTLIHTHIHTHAHSQTHPRTSAPSGFAMTVDCKDCLLPNHAYSLTHRTHWLTVLTDPPYPLTLRTHRTHRTHPLTHHTSSESCPLAHLVW